MAGLRAPRRLGACPTLLLLLLAGACQGQTLENDCLRELLTLRRVYVDRLGGGEAAAQMRDMIISSLQNARLFVITEKEERADAVLRGSAEDLVFTEHHQSNDGITARASLSGGRGVRSLPGAGITVGDHESQNITERKHEAMASVRLVNKDGDVVWATTQESLGGKFRGSSADVAEKITRQLADDFAKARQLPSAQ
jgi:hypothetical protein